MRLTCLLLLLAIRLPAATLDGQFNNAPQLPDSLIQEVCGCWQKTLFMEGRVRELSVKINTTLGNRAIKINIVLSEYNNNMLFVKLVAFPRPSGT